MKFGELLALTPISISYDVGRLSTALSNLYTQQGRPHPIGVEATEFLSDASDAISEAKRVEIREYLETGDDKYGAELSMVFFDGSPVFAYSRYGRYYSNADVFLFSAALLDKMASFFRDFYQSEEDVLEELNIQDAEVPDEIGGHSVLMYCNPEFKARFNVGDTVWAYVPYDHLRYSFEQKYVIAKVVIQSVHMHQIEGTYHGMQVSRGWDNSKDWANRRMLVGPTVSQVGASFSDYLVLGKVGEIPDPENNVYALSDAEGFLSIEQAFSAETVDSLLNM